MGSYEHDEHSKFHKSREFLEQVNNYELPKKDLASWSWLVGWLVGRCVCKIDTIKTLYVTYYVLIVIMFVFILLQYLKKVNSRKIDYWREFNRQHSGILCLCYYITDYIL
jgi:hypothetical protein